MITYLTTHSEEYPGAGEGAGWWGCVCLCVCVCVVCFFFIYATCKMLGGWCLRLFISFWMYTCSLNACPVFT